MLQHVIVCVIVAIESVHVFVYCVCVVCGLCVREREYRNRMEKRTSKRGVNRRRNINLQTSISLEAVLSLLYHLFFTIACENFSHKCTFDGVYFCVCLKTLLRAVGRAFALCVQAMSVLYEAEQKRDGDRDSFGRERERRRSKQLIRH